ncbi:uncharacterized protein FIBRA_01561 [Fibroporia radiculosa]|uniref:Uncharacterized protein n=1 Tax=Fibroporia radiculosa TaxID=599839 RepID=J4G121_9APHY|nr:uncharacterized protein FIBRA_01561 [Fibroporia radiculosa]CCL99543.1 predicted protein [Fibroporia radiculosa]
MQAYPSSDQGYYPPTQYAQPQTTYYPQYTPYHPYLPPQQPVAPQYSTYSAQYDQSPQYPTPAPARRKLSRGASTGGVPTTSNRPGTPGAPRRSAMKKHGDRAPSASAVSLSRQTSASDARQRVNSLTRPRSNSASHFLPDHLFVSFIGSNELRVENICYQTTLDGLREAILPMWPQGVSFQDSRGHGWRVQFAGSPWTSTRTDAILAQRLICRLYMILAKQGYSYLTTVQTGYTPQPPRMIFVDSIPDLDVEVFLITFSRSKLRLRLLDAPPGIVQQLEASLRAVFPRKISSHAEHEDGIHVIEVKREGIRPRDQDKNLFLACVLRLLNTVGFKLDGSIPLGKRGPFGFGPRQEAWIFRSTMRQLDGRQKS